MKAIMIIFNQALSEQIVALFDDLAIRGFTKMNDLQGRGSVAGEPRMGTHTWPALNNAIYAFVSEEQAQQLIKALKDLNREAGATGLKAFSWDADVAVE